MRNIQLLSRTLQLLNGLHHLYQRGRCPQDHMTVTIDRSSFARRTRKLSVEAAEVISSAELSSRGGVDAPWTTDGPPVIQTQTHGGISPNLGPTAGLKLSVSSLSTNVARSDPL